MESLLQNFAISFFVTYVPLNEKIRFYRQQFSPSFNKTGKLQFSALHLPKCLCLEYVQYTNPPKECRQSINYANNNLTQHIDWLLTYILKV